MAPAFQEYRIRDLDPRVDASLVIERTLEYGTRKEIKWLFANYEPVRIRDFVRKSGSRRLSKRAFNYWRLVLGVDRYRRPPFERTRQALWSR